MKKYKLKEISTIEEIEFNGEVHDIQIEDDHSYTVSDNIAVHNSVCETRKNTGVGVPQLKAIRDIRRIHAKVPIIADGGIKHYGDVPKALKYANGVMVGSMIAGTSETPGHVYKNDKGEFYKVYGGSASGERKVENGGDNSFVEGVIKIVPFKGKVKYIIYGVKDAIRSSMSYSGAPDLKTFRERAIMFDIGSGGKSESKI
jgi:IMP dehydrogenase